MSNKPKCSQCNERDVFSKGLCSGCYGRNWRERRKAERAAIIAERFPPKQLSSGVTSVELGPITVEGEIVHDAPHVPETHLTALNPVEMQAAQGDMRAHLEQKLTVIERDIVEANAALNEARKYGWATGALTSARNRLVDDETYYNKVLAAVEAGYTLIPEFPIEVFAVRRGSPDKRESFRHTGNVSPRETWLSHPISADCAPAGAGEYRNPDPETISRTHWDAEGNRAEALTITKTGNPTGPIMFPHIDNGCMPNGN